MEMAKMLGCAASGVSRDAKQKYDPLFAGDEVSEREPRGHFSQKSAVLSVCSSACIGEGGKRY